VSTSRTFRTDWAMPHPSEVPAPATRYRSSEPLRYVATRFRPLDLTKVLAFVRWGGQGGDVVKRYQFRVVGQFEDCVACYFGTVPTLGGSGPPQAPHHQLSFPSW
jgi:hypothetical protein